MGEATAQVTKIIAASPTEVWTALTTPASLKKFFFGADVESDFRVGSPIRFRGEVKGKPYEDKGEIRISEPQQSLAFSHFSPLSGKPELLENYHVVSFELAPTTGGTKVTLTQSNLTGGVTASDREHRAEFERNWMMLLDGLSKLVGKREEAPRAL